MGRDGKGREGRKGWEGRKVMGKEGRGLLEREGERKGGMGGRETIGVGSGGPRGPGPPHFFGGEA